MNRKGTCEAQKTVGCCIHTTATFAFLLLQLFVCTNHHRCKSIQTDQATRLSWFLSSASIEGEEVILDLYLLKSDSVNPNILSPVLVLQQCHPNKLQGCRKNCTRVVSIATPTREQRLGSALLPLQLNVQKAVITEFCESYLSTPSTVLWGKFSEKMFLPINILSFLTVKGQTATENTQTLLKYWFDQVLGKQHRHLRSGLTWIQENLG